MGDRKASGGSYRTEVVRKQPRTSSEPARSWGGLRPDKHRVKGTARTERYGASTDKVRRTCGAGTEKVRTPRGQPTAPVQPRKEGIAMSEVGLTGYTRQFRGRFGQIVFRELRGKSIASLPSRRAGQTNSPGQILVRDTFR